MKIAIVHDWLTTLGGSELVLRELLRIYPGAHVYTLFDKMAAADRSFIGVGDTTTSFLDKIPGGATYYRRFLPLFPLAVRSLNVRGYDLVISSSHAAAKNVYTSCQQLHVCYCHSPMRYAWDLREQYLRESGNADGMRGSLARALLDALRDWDRHNSKRVDVFVTNSAYIADRIKRAYHRDATVIHPPVDTNFFTPAPSDAPAPRGDYFMTTSRFVPYKRIDLIVNAFAALPDHKLVVAGTGPDEAKVRAAAANAPNVSLVGHVSRDALRALLRDARAFVFAADEDFGIAPVEAQACGVPVIAYGHGGSLETVSGARGPQRTGVFFPEQTPVALAAAIREFESLPTRISPDACRKNAERFSEQRFRTEFGGLVDRAWRRHSSPASSSPS